MILSHPYLSKAALATLVSGVIASPTSVFALGIRLPDQDAQAAARGEAFVATADNPSAIYYNPAGISQLDGQHASLGAYGVTLGSQFKPATGGKVDTKTTLQAVPHFFYTAKCPQCPVSFGLGVYSPYGLGLEWPESSPFGHMKGSMEYLTLNPVVAWQVLPTLSIAAGPTLNWAETSLEMQGMRFRGRDVDAGYTAGVLWKPLVQHSFGVSYRSTTDMNFDGHTDIPAYGISGAPTTADFALPQNVVFGYSYRPTTNWNFEVDADWTDWESLNALTLRGAPIPSMLYNWQSSWFYEFGATRYLENGWSISGGYIFSQNSVPEATFSPMVPDSDRHIFSLGLGKKYEVVSWDLAYQFAWGPERTIDGPMSSYNGNYEFISHALILDVGFKF